MPDARHLAEQINTLLRDAPRSDDGTGAFLASGYAALSRAAHDRLARCRELLAAGLRSEAVQEAEVEPELLMLVAALEVEDFEAWAGYCRRHGLDQPWPMPAAIVHELNRAYAADQLVAPLLREYRFRCVMRMPVKDRIAALRALAGVDHSNRLWVDALVTCEQQRLREMVLEVEAAGGDLEALQAIQRELLDDRRKVTPPRLLVERADEALRSARVDHAQGALHELLPAINDAYIAMDYPACRALLETWTGTLKSVGKTTLQVPADLRERVEPILQWVEREDRQRQLEAQFGGACARLERLVEASAPLPELDRAYREAAAFERAMPEPVMQAYQAQVRRQRLTQTRRRRVRVVAATLLLAVLAGAGVWYGINRARHQRVAEYLAVIDTSLDSYELNNAAASWDELQRGYPTLARNADAQQRKARLEGAQRLEAERLERFEGLREQITALPASQVTAGVLTQLEGLSRTPQEKAAVTEQRRRWSAEQSRQARERDAGVLGRVAELREGLDSVDAAGIDADPGAVLSRVGAAQAKLRLLRATPGLTKRTLAAIDTTEARAAALSRSAGEAGALQQRQAQRATAVERIAGAGASSGRLTAALSAYVAEFPESPDAAEFGEALGQAASWRAVEAWERLRRSWGGALEPAKVETVARRLREVDAYLKDHPASPWSAEVSAYRGFWGRALLATAEDGPWRRALPELTRAPVFRDLGMATTRDGRRYYVVGDGNRRETSLGTTIEVVLTPDTTKPTTMNFPAGMLGPVEDSPQAKLAARLLAQVATLDLKNFHTFPVDVVREVLTADGVDPVLKAVTVKLVIDDDERTVGSLDPALAVVRDRLSVHGNAAVNWLDPQNRPAQTVRQYLADTLGELPDLGEVRKGLDAQRRRIHAGVAARILGRGVLMRHGGSVTVVGVEPAVSRPATLQVVVNAAVDGAGDAGRAGGAGAAAQARRFKRIGGVTQGGEVAIDRSAAAGVPSGSMVFFVAADTAGTVDAAGAGRAGRVQRTGGATKP